MGCDMSQRRGLKRYSEGFTDANYCKYEYSYLCPWKNSKPGPFSKAFNRTVQAIMSAIQRIDTIVFLRMVRNTVINSGRSTSEMRLFEVQ